MNDRSITPPLNIALVIGCARSGTSILGELIAAHPDVRYVFEAVTVWERGGSGENDSHRLIAAHATPALSKETRDWAAATVGNASILVEKSPRNILRVPYVRAIFPEAKLIHIVRDGRDVACSMVPGCGGDRWSHLKPPSWKRLFETAGGALRCALAWRDILEVGLEDLQGVPHLQVRYEDLVASPLTVAATVFAYLKLDLHHAALDFTGRISNDTASPHHASQQTQWYRPDHKTRVGRWRENLAPLEQDEINEILAPMLGRLGYIDTSIASDPHQPRVAI